MSIEDKIGERRSFLKKPKSMNMKSNNSNGSLGRKNPHDPSRFEI
jgi:hypothetical protein